MKPSDKELISDNTIDYLYITLFMLTYRKKSNRYFIGVLDEAFRKLKTELQLGVSTKKTIHYYRRELIEKINSRYFPDSNITIDDPIDLSLLVSVITIELDLQFPTEFYEDVKFIEETIADDLVGMKDQVIDYFYKLSKSNTSIYTYNFSLLLVLVIDFIENYYLPAWKDSFISIKEHLLTTFASTLIPFELNSSQALVKLPKQMYIPDKLLSLLEQKISFLIIFDKEYKEIINFGDTSKLIPTFESKLRESFQGKLPTTEFTELLLKIIDLVVNNSQIRKQLRDQINQEEKLNHETASKAPA